MNEFKAGDVRHLTLVLGVNHTNKNPQMQFTEFRNGVRYKFVYDIVGSPEYEEVEGLFRVKGIRYKSEDRLFFVMEVDIVEIKRLKHNTVKADKRKKYQRTHHSIPHDKYWEIKGHR
jgi:hypothetical protein